MQSVVHCTHYVAGPGEQAYLHPEEAPDITFINRDPIDRSDEAYTDFPVPPSGMLPLRPAILMSPPHSLRSGGVGSPIAFPPSLSRRKPPRPPNNMPADPKSLLAFGAHPDDIEFGCGGVIASETRAGRSAHPCGVLPRRVRHQRHARRSAPRRRGAAARLLGATIEFVDLGGDAHFEAGVAPP